MGFCCFEVLGFDVLFDALMKPWLIEVNRSPAMTTDTRLDELVKEAVITEALQLACIRPQALLEAKIGTALEESVHTGTELEAGSTIRGIHQAKVEELRIILDEACVII